MIKRVLYLFLTIVTVMTFLGNSIAATQPNKPGFTEIGHQTDGNYYYTFYADLSKAPDAIAYIQVQKNTTGEVLPLDNFKGKVLFGRPLFSIKDKATVSFYDGATLISKDLTGVIEGGVKP
ncbi:hypothetical protein [Chitinophaga rhizophila]|uniref:NlpE-like protein n=1 Tax=Chitinophaga rhizophila TaxID=2866212 RepID=A0ABS7GHF1_9BACT|nr:hypothetical protein [Chitinophaga rhizophila]MBW8687117.1 hypothetical protein [Chitinophaga rhizophila]